MKKIIPILVVGILVLSGLGVAALNSDIEKFDSETIDYKKRYSTHTVLGEYGTYTGCEPSKYAHRALKNTYAGGYHPFYYITFVHDKNTHAYQRIKDELGLIVTPTVYFDGGYDKKVGGTNVETEMARYNASIIACGNRDVADIDLSLDVTWLGAVNNDPKDGATEVGIDGILNWTNAAMDVEVTVDNNEASQYDGHLHVYVTEINSTMWQDKYGDPYTFEFKSYAFNEDIAISAGDTWDDSAVWDGEHQTDGHGTNFTDVIQSNIMVIASVFDEDSDYTDETTGFVTGVGNDPKTYDVYFGNTTPPPKIASNIYGWTFTVGEELSFDTTYYWKIDVWDNLGNPTYGDIWSFTTRDNNPPYTPSNPVPPDGATNVSEGICWTGGDPDGDPVTYDVYLGNTRPPPKISSNQSSNCTDPGLLKFNTTYYWKIVAWDIYGASAEGPIWSFTTQINLPPYEPDDPHPPDSGTTVPVNITLCWEGNDPNPGDIVTYDVYLGVNCPNLVSNNQSENYYATELELNKTYFWKIVSWDSQKLRAEGDVWSFHTGINHPPDAPIITKENIKNIRIRSRSVPRPAPIPGPHNYTFEATDPDGHDVYYWIEWDDGQFEGWLGPYPSGEEITVEHTWDNVGTYSIRAKAKDIYDAESEWGYLKVIMPKDKQVINPIFFRFLGRFFLMLE